MNQTSTPLDNPTAIIIGGIVIMAIILYKCFGNVQTDVHRRMLQNFVYRLYQLNTWFFSLIRGFDAGVGMYYTTMESTKIAPVNEKRFQPILIKREHPKKEPILLPNENKMRSGWNWRKVVGG